jgi:hypothetical protein
MPLQALLILKLATRTCALQRETKKKKAKIIIEGVVTVWGNDL